MGVIYHPNSAIALTDRSSEGFYRGSLDRKILSLTLPQDPHDGFWEQIAEHSLREHRQESETSISHLPEILWAADVQ